MRLGDPGGNEVSLGGKGALPGARKRDPRPERIVARVAKFVDTYTPTREVRNGRDVGGTTPLNCGFFKLERMRSATVAKARGEGRGKMRGK